MRRLARWTLRATTKLFLLVCAAITVLWWHSYRRADMVTYWSRGERTVNLCFTSADGVLSLRQLRGANGWDMFSSASDGPVAYQTPPRIEFDSQPVEPDKIYDIGWQPSSERAWRRFYFRARFPQFYAAPHWASAAAAGAFPAIALVRRLRRARTGRNARTTGVCPGCGYDMRATPEKCPECGRSCGAEAG